MYIPKTFGKKTKAHQNSVRFRFNAVQRFAGYLSNLKGFLFPLMIGAKSFIGSDVK